MGDESMTGSMTHEIGTNVWCRILDWIWWPGKIVSLESSSEEIKAYVSAKKKKYIAVVLFETDKTREVVVNKNKLMLYNCSNKMTYVEKGYVLYLKQLKGGHIRGNFNMKNFITDVSLAEQAAGGDENIFERLKKKYEIIVPKVNYKKLFVSSKDKAKEQKSIAAREGRLAKQVEKSQNVKQSKRNEKKKQLLNSKSPKKHLIPSGNQTGLIGDILNDLEDDSNDTNLGKSSEVGRTMEASTSKSCTSHNKNFQQATSSTSNEPNTLEESRQIQEALISLLKDIGEI